MNKSAVRRALTTLKKNIDISTQLVDDNKILFGFVVPEDLIQPKKKVYISKTTNKIKTTNNATATN